MVSSFNYEDDGQDLEYNWWYWCQYTCISTGQALTDYAIATCLSPQNTKLPNAPAPKTYYHVTDRLPLENRNMRILLSLTKLIIQQPLQKLSNWFYNGPFNRSYFQSPFINCKVYCKRAVSYKPTQVPTDFRHKPSSQAFVTSLRTDLCNKPFKFSK
jgi:hypothetical protein